MKQRKSIDVLLKKAEEGEVNAMEDVAYCYHEWSNGFPVDKAKAFWNDKARASGSVRGMTEVGHVLKTGIGGVRKDEKRDLLYLSLAAERGSDWAAYWMGLTMADGLYAWPSS